MHASISSPNCVDSTTSITKLFIDCSPAISLNSFEVGDVAGSGSLCNNDCNFCYYDNVSSQSSTSDIRRLSSATTTTYCGSKSNYTNIPKRLFPIIAPSSSYSHLNFNYQKNNCVAYFNLRNNTAHNSHKNLISKKIFLRQTALLNNQNQRRNSYNIFYQQKNFLYNKKCSEKQSKTNFKSIIFYLILILLMRILCFLSLLIEYI